MAVQAVIFDWGGTLTPWHSINPAQQWSQICAAQFPAGQAADQAAALHAAEDALWRLCRDELCSATMAALFERAGLTATEAFLARYVAEWEQHTFTDPDVLAVFEALRAADIRIGVLSNTMWPRAWHDDIFRRDGVLDLIDGAVYTSEIDWSKPHPEAFRAAMAAVGVTDPADCVFVGDRPYDDVHGAASVGMRTVLVPNSDVPPYPAAAPDAVISRLADLLPVISAW